MIRPVFRLHLKRLLALSFVALGPLGNIFTPHFFPESFRTYYFLLPFFPLFFTQTRERLGKIAIFLLPFFLYCYVSAFFVEQWGDANEPHTLFRFFLFFCQFFFVLGMASSLRKREEIGSALRIYLRFFFISMAIGYVFFIGYYLKVIPFGVISRFSVIAQFGFGLLRFSPGSYPNEYGIVSSFVLSLLILIHLEKRKSEFGLFKGSFPFLFLATFLAFLLTTTRAAYLSFAVSMIYIAWKSGYFLRALTFFVILIGAIFLLLLCFKLNMFLILSAGFSEKITEGSLGDRYFMWLDAIDRVQNHFFWGTGFASLTNLHNVYLQLLFELGLMGTALFLVTVGFTWIESLLKYKRRTEEDPFLQKVKMVGLINVLSFAASNHNINHHLTWFICFLCFASLRLAYLEKTEKRSPERGDPLMN